LLPLELLREMDKLGDRCIFWKDGDGRPTAPMAARGGDGGTEKFSLLLRLWVVEIGDGRTLPLWEPLREFRRCKFSSCVDVGMTTP